MSMDITPIYDLQTRLKAGAIAGTGLIAQDFRLKRAVEAMQPLAASSPVFARLTQLAGAVTEPDCADREGALLDALTLADAVLCTQGTVAADGPLEPLRVNGCGSMAADVPYSRMSALMDALTNSGGGRFSLVLDTHSRQPELFEDYRVKAALVQALGASYAELADQAFVWLKESGESLLPLLRSGFDPRGRKEMVRRVQLMEAVSGERANDFYLEQLPHADKDVRGALIYALRHEPGNADLLLDLSRTEKGNCKKMAYWALAGMEDKEVQEFWKDLWKRKPREVLPYLEEACTGWACETAAEGLMEILSPWKEGTGRTGALEKEGTGTVLTGDLAAMINLYLKALPGKSGDKVCQCFRLASSLESRLDRRPEGEKEIWTLTVPCADGYSRNLIFSQAVPAVLHYALLVNPDEGLAQLAVQLCEALGEDYFPAALTAMMLTTSAQDCAQWVESKVWKKTLLGRKKRRETFQGLKEALCAVSWDAESGSYVLGASRISPADGRTQDFRHPLAPGVQDYFIELLMECGDRGLDEVLARFIQPGNDALCSRLADYFYKRAMAADDNRRYLEPLKRCGVSDCSGLGVRYCRGKGKLSYWELYSYLQQLPGDAAARALEARRIYELAEKGEVKIPHISQEQLESLIQELMKG